MYGSSEVIGFQENDMNQFNCSTNFTSTMAVEYSVADYLLVTSMNNLG